MTKNYSKFIGAGLILSIVIIFVALSLPRKKLAEVKPQTMPTNSEAKTDSNKFNLKQTRLRPTELADNDQEAFQGLFETKLKPAIAKFCEAYQGHVPFSLAAVTPDKLVERIGRNAAFYDYTFVIDGITLSVGYKNGAVKVDYLNDAKQSPKLMALPQGEQPVIEYPVTRLGVIQMVNKDSGMNFADPDIRMIQSGVSSAMNGGVHVEVGGDPENCASWNYTLVFGNNGNLVYYCKGPDKKFKQQP
jgi:hypothetical protein